MASRTEHWLSSGEVARRCGVTRRAVSSWCLAGLLPGAWKTPGSRGRWRIPERSVETITHIQGGGQ
jgi:predicted site-specific integrase-resolvase